jgi:hypothetical protein
MTIVNGIYILSKKGLNGVAHQVLVSRLERSLVLETVYIDKTMIKIALLIFSNIAASVYKLKQK